MACELLMLCDLIFGTLECNLPEETIDVILKGHTLRGKHTFGKDRTTWNIKSSSLGTKVQPYSSLKKKMVEFMRHRRTIATPFTNRSLQPRPKVVAKCNLASLTTLNRAKHSHPRKINVEPLPEATQWNWAATLGKAKDVAGIKTAWLPCRQTSHWIHHPHYLPVHLNLL